MDQPQNEETPTTSRQYYGDNFCFGPSDYTKFYPAEKTNCLTNRRMWLFRANLFHQVQGFHHERCTEMEIPSINIPNTFSPLPSTSHEKMEMFWETLANVMSCTYAVFLVTLGIFVYLTDILLGKHPSAEIFSLYLVVPGLLYLIFLYIDIRHYFSKLTSCEKVLKNHSRDSIPENDDKETNSVEGISFEPQTGFPKYSFHRGKHVGSFYLKVGAAGFCLGHLIHSGLLLVCQAALFITDSQSFYQCASFATLTLDILYPLYSFSLLFFIFKYSNVRINRYEIIGKFAIMHCIGSSLCFWVWTILKETVDSLPHRKTDYPTALHLLTSNETFNSKPDEEEKGNRESENVCQASKQYITIFENLSPYLYPFTIEYNILVAGVLCVIWNNIGTNDSLSLVNGNGNFISNVVIYADCHASNKGLFGGLIVIAGTIISTIIFYVTMSNSSSIDTGLIVNEITELILLFVMTATVLLAYKSVSTLDINSGNKSTHDMFMMFLCLPAFFLHAILSIPALWNSKRYLNLVKILLQILQVLIQVPFMIDGLQRCSNSKTLQKEKPGRELIMFLIVCNLAMWITQTFQIHSHSHLTDPRSFIPLFAWLIYGKMLTQKILIHL